ARGIEHDAGDVGRRVSGERGGGDGGARKDEHIVGEIDDGDARRADVPKGGRLEERFDDQHIIAPIDAHGRDVDATLFVERGENGFDDHAPVSRATRSANAPARRTVTGPGAPLGIGRPSTCSMGASSRMELVRKASPAAARSSGRSTSSRAIRPMAEASSSTTARVMPGRTPHASGGVRIVAPVTTNRLLAVASDRCPAVSRKIASSAPAARACDSATTDSTYASVLTPVVAANSLRRAGAVHTRTVRAERGSRGGSAL